MMNKIKKKDLKGSFDKLDDEQKEIVMQIVENISYYWPGGTISITPKELTDCLALHWLRHRTNDREQRGVDGAYEP